MSRITFKGHSEYYTFAYRLYYCVHIIYKVNCLHIKENNPFVVDTFAEYPITAIKYRKYVASSFLT